MSSPWRKDNNGDVHDPIQMLLNGAPKESKKENPWIIVRPRPGFCVKTRTLEGDKVFMNVCFCDEIPPPRNISDEELIGILESDEAPNYKVPMSLGELHTESDNSANLCNAYDIAINTEFYNKIITNELFKTFFMTVVMEGLQSKYFLELPIHSENPYIILKNRKCLGTIQVHRIEQRPVRTEPPKKKLIEVISSTDFDDYDDSGNNKDLSKHPMAVDEDKRLKLFIVRKNNKDEEPYAIVAFAFIRACSSSDISLDIGEDVVLINSLSSYDHYQFYVPVKIINNYVSADYFVQSQVLRIILPVNSGS